jgi:hypothetical protein
MKIIVIIAAILALANCTLQGPFTVEASYPGYFRIIVSLDSPAGSRLLPSTQFQRYHEEFDTTNSILEVSVYADKNPPDVAAQGDLGTLEVTLNGDFGELRGSAPLGNTETIYLHKYFLGK